MRAEEARLVGEFAAEAVGGGGGVCLNLGSSSQAFAEKSPHLVALYDELRRRGIRIVNVDFKDAPGVDIVGDITTAEVQRRIAEVAPDLVLLCNVLEHVPDPRPLCDAIQRILPVGAHLICTVPRSYPYHPDPIDTLFRPSLAELSSLFPGLRLVRGQEVRAGRFFSNRRGRSRRAYAVSYGVRLLFPFVRPRAWLWRAHNLAWLFRDYRVTCALFTRPK